MPINKKDFKNAQKGAAMVEFAIIVPLLLLLVVGISEFGFAFYHLNILNKSVQDAARYFSDPLQARQGVLSDAIDVSSGNPAVANAINLVIYGNTAVPSPCIATTSPPCPLMPNAANYTSPNPPYYVYCAEENAPNKICLSATQHIRVTAIYQHNFILGNTLNRLTSGAVPNVYALTASSVLRVE